MEIIGIPYSNSKTDLPLSLQRMQLTPAAQSLLCVIHNHSQDDRQACYAGHTHLIEQMELSGYSARSTYFQALHDIREQGILNEWDNGSVHYMRISEIYYDDELNAIQKRIMDKSEQVEGYTRKEIMLQDLMLKEHELDAILKSKSDSSPVLFAGKVGISENDNRTHNYNNYIELSNNKQTTPVVVENDNSQSLKGKEGSDDSELSVLAESFDVSESFLALQMKKFSKDIAFMKRLLFYAKERADTNLKGYVIRCLRDDIQFDEQKKEYRYTGNRNLTDAERQADAQRQAEAMRIIAAEEQSEKIIEDECHDKDIAIDSLTTQAVKPQNRDEIIGDLQVIYGRKKAFWETKVTERKRNHEAWDDILVIGRKELDTLKVKIEKVASC